MIASRLTVPLTISIALTAGLLSSAAAAEGPSGTVVAVIQQASATGGPPGKRILSPQTSVYMGDLIQTGPVGEAQLRFRDQTKLVVGPNSKLVIDSFVFKDRGTAQDVSINAVRGTFRFITGNSPKSAYALNTPVATIGVRGTQFDFNVDADGKTSLVLYEGSARVCDKAGGCVELRQGCGIAVVPPRGPARSVARVSERQAMLSGAFPYLQNQQGLQRAFRTMTSSCGLSSNFSPYGGGGGSNGIAPRSAPPAPTPPAPPAPTPAPPAPTPPAPPHHHHHDDGHHWGGGYSQGGGSEGPPSFQHPTTEGNPD